MNFRLMFLVMMFSVRLVAMDTTEVDFTAVSAKPVDWSKVRVDELDLRKYYARKKLAGKGVRPGGSSKFRFASIRNLLKGKRRVSDQA